jgi:hypothetical protein
MIAPRRAYYYLDLLRRMNIPVRLTLPTTMTGGIGTVWDNGTTQWDTSGARSGDPPTYWDNHLGAGIRYDIVWSRDRVLAASRVSSPVNLPTG